MLAVGEVRCADSLCFKAKPILELLENRTQAEYK